MDLSLNKDFYNRQVVEETVRAFKEAGTADFDLKEKEKEIVVEVENLDEEINFEDLKDKFHNFLITQIKRNRNGQG